MHIKVIAVDVTTTPNQKGSYSTAEVTYKNVTYGGKVESKKVMSFGVTKSTFEVMSNATAGEEYTITVVKNEKGYNDWVSATPGHNAEAPAAAAPAQRATTPAPNVGKAQGTAYQQRDWETAEERAKKQIYIVRQHNLSAAIELLTTGAKAPPTMDDVLKVAKEFETYVFGDSTEVAKEGAAALADMDDDIPF